MARKADKPQTEFARMLRKYRKLAQFTSHKTAAAKLTEIRLKAGFSPETAYVAEATWGHWESGKPQSEALGPREPDFRQAMQICQMLNVGADDLMPDPSKF